MDRSHSFVGTDLTLPIEIFAPERDVFVAIVRIERSDEKPKGNPEALLTPEFESNI